MYTRHALAPLAQGKPGLRKRRKRPQGEAKAVAVQKELCRVLAGEFIQPAASLHGGKARLRALVARAERLRGAREARGQQEIAFSFLQRCPGQQELIFCFRERTVRAGERRVLAARVQPDPHLVAVEFHHLFLPLAANAQAGALEGFFREVQQVRVLSEHRQRRRVLRKGAKAARRCRHIAQFCASGGQHRPGDAGKGAGKVLPEHQGVDGAALFALHARAGGGKGKQGIAAHERRAVRAERAQGIAKLGHGAYPGVQHLHALRHQPRRAGVKQRQRYCRTRPRQQKLSGAQAGGEGLRRARRLRGVGKRQAVAGKALLRARAPHAVALQPLSLADDLVGPDLDAGQELRARECPRARAQHAFLERLRLRFQARVARQHAAARLRLASNTRAWPEDRALDAGARLHHRARADHGILAHQRPALHARPGADVAGLFHARVLVHQRALLHARGRIQFQLSLQKLGMRAQVSANIADIAPVALQYAAVNGAALPDESGEQFAAKIAGPALGDERKDLRFEDVDAGVHRVGNSLARPGFFHKGAHAAICRGDDQTVFQRIGNAREHHRRQRLVFAVEGEGGGEVEIGHAVAGEHAERFVEKIRRLPHAARRAQGRALGVVAQGKVPVAAVAEEIHDGVGQIAQRHRRLAHAVLFEQFQRVFHHRPVEQPHHGLWLVAGQRPQPRAFAARHDDRFHANTPIEEEYIVYLCNILPDMGAKHAILNKFAHKAQNRGRERAPVCLRGCTFLRPWTAYRRKADPAHTRHLP